MLTRRRAIGGGAALAAAGSVARAARSNGTWTARRSMPFAVQEIYPAGFWRMSSDSYSLKPTQRGVLVNAGGLSPDPAFSFNVTDLVTVYDPIGDEWGYGPALPEPRHHIALVFHNGYIFALSGFRRNHGGGWQMQNSVWRLADLRNGRWQTMTSLPIPQSEAVALSVGGRLHFIGGRAPAGTSNRVWSDHIDTDNHWAYDSAADRWDRRAPIPTARNSAAGATINRVIYVIGGRTVSDGNSSVCEVYDPWSDRWQSARPMPKPERQTAPRGQSGLAAAAWNGKIYVFGGEWYSLGGNGVYADVWEYNPREDTWRSVAAMPRPRHGLGAVALSDGIYVAGGATGPSDEGTSAFLDRFEI
jgi:hypothetical protein